MAADTAARPLTPDSAGGSAEERLTNLFFLFLSSGYLAYLAILAPLVVAQAGLTAAWWAVLGPTLVFGPAIAMGIAGLLKRPVWARRAAAASAILFVVAVLTWPFAWNGELTGTDVWFSLIPGMAGLAATIIWRPQWALVLLAAAVIPAQLINHAAREPSINGLLLPDMIFSYSFCLLFVAAACMAMRTGRMLDSTRASAHAAAASAAATSARAVQRNRYNALLHDWVMSALLAAARQSDTDEVRKQAQVTLAKLDELYSEQIDVYDAAGLLAYVRTSVGAIDDTLLVEAHVTPDAQSETFPSEAVHAVGEAVGEAVRNSLLHAGPSARRGVEVTVDRGRFKAVVTDTGRGFDVKAIPPHRLGVAVSIVGRVRALPGGSADVRSLAGAGTTVTASWQSAP
ncbi:MAG TPA: ATP-binding protein [Aldersonia sp.]